jgi:hypothetical protein
MDMSGGLHLPVEQPGGACCRVVRTEKISGKSREGRDQLSTGISCRHWATGCRVSSLIGWGDQPAMSLISFTSSTKGGAFLRIHEPAISTDEPMGKKVLAVLGMVANLLSSWIKLSKLRRLIDYRLQPFNRLLTFPWRHFLDNA